MEATLRGTAQQRSLDAAASPDPTLPYRNGLELSEIVGHSAVLARLLARLKAVVALDRLGILLTGETGTGKSLIARVLHRNGPRACSPFVVVNCGAIPADLWEAEFFGSARSAYTQAADRLGRFAAADGGTLFLDEVGEIPLAQQAKLLRVLDEGRFERLGEDRTRLANVRVIAATNRDLVQSVSDGTFRKDLYFRLNRYPIHVPSLAERPEDVAPLAVVIVERECKKLGLPPLWISPNALASLEQREWPGNVRELESVLAQAIAEAWAEGEASIEAVHFLDGRPSALSERPLPRHARLGLTLSQATRAFQHEFLKRELAHAGWNVSAVARRLELSRSSLYKLLKEFALRRPGPALPAACAESRTGTSGLAVP